MSSYKKSFSSVEVFDDDELIMISALQSYLFCKRQVALLHLENVWSDNLLTIQGSILHDRVHNEKIAKGAKKTKETGLALCNLTLGITGKADCVEYLTDGSIVIVEYKRGKPKKHHADEVQLCAQALCLEEMTNKEIDKGFLYYGEPRRRYEVIFTEELRQLTKKTIIDLRKLMGQGETPKAIYKKSCNLCAQQNYCSPQVSSLAKKYLEKMIDCED